MSTDSAFLIAGVALTVATLVAYWYLWPRDGAAHPLLRSGFEPAIMVGLTTGLVLGGGLFFAGLVPG